MKFEPMLAATMTDVTQVAWPKWASPKFDGYRCLIVKGVAMSRNLKPIPNGHIQTLLGRRELNGLDGELIVGSATGTHVFTRTSSGVRRAKGTPDFRFFVFDDCSVSAHSFLYRLGHAEDRIADAGLNFLAHVEHTEVHSSAGLLKYEKEMLQRGYEGVMLRNPECDYKFGRATEREDSLWKVKRFTDGEARVVSVEEGQHNTNEATLDALGRKKRSTVKAGMQPSGLVGSILADDLATGARLRIAPGRMTAPMRSFYLQHPEQIVRKVVKYKSFAYGAKDMDRFPTFQAILDEDDVPGDLVTARAHETV